MNEKDKNNLRGHIKKCIRETDVSIHTDLKFVLPVFPFSLQDEINTFINRKLKDIPEIYDKRDIWWMIISHIATFLKYDELRNKITNNSDNRGFVSVGKLPDFLDRSKFIDIANKIIERLVNPTKSYALLQLPNVELPENIKINNDLFLVAGIDDYFKVHDNDKKDFTFPFEGNKTYLFLEQLGVNFRWKSTESLLFKNLLQKLKSFLGLSLIMDIFDTPSIPVDKSEEKRNRALPLGIFSAATEWSECLWWEGVSEEDYEDSGWYDPMPEDHPDFNDMQDAYSQGDEFLEFCFQKRFFIEDEINLPQIYVDLVNSLAITGYATKPSFRRILMEEEIIKPLPQFEKLESPGQFLRKKFDKIRIILNSNDDYAQRIKSAALWYLEGYCAESDTFKFIDYTIAVESLLGRKDKDKEENIPLTQTLSDRCGFSLGKNLKEKEKIRKKFKDIYDIRSRIVHSGKVILNEDDNKYLNRLEEMTKQLISDAIETYSPECNDHPLEV